MIGTSYLGFTYDCADDVIADNTIVVPVGASKFAAPFNVTGTFTEGDLAPYLDGTKGNQWLRNAYTTPADESYWTWATANKTWAEWQGLGNDVGGSRTIA